MSEALGKLRERGIGSYVREGLRKIGYWVGREYDYHRVHPRDALFFLTYRCTSRCRTCTMWQRLGKEGELDLEGWKQAVDFSRAMGAKFYELFGGDALLRKDILVPLTAYIKSFPDLSCELVTNSNLMDRETAFGLVEAGIDHFWVSMDGVEGVHDEVRGRGGTFEKVKSCIDWILEAKGDRSAPQIHSNCTISKYNVQYFEKVLPYAASRGIEFVHLEYAGEFWPETVAKSEVDGIKPSPYFIRQGEETCLVNAEEARLIKDKVAAMKIEARRLGVSLRAENIDKLTIENMVRGRFNNQRCYIARTKITIDPRGNVLGCPFFGDWKMGNIMQEPLQSIWKNGSHKKFLRAFKRGQFPFCDYCILGVQRNPTVWQDVRDTVNGFLGRVRS